MLVQASNSAIHTIHVFHDQTTQLQVHQCRSTNYFNCYLSSLCIYFCNMPFHGAKSHLKQIIRLDLPNHNGLKSRCGFFMSNSINCSLWGHHSFAQSISYCNIVLLHVFQLSIIKQESANQQALISYLSGSLQLPLSI